MREFCEGFVQDSTRKCLDFDGAFKEFLLLGDSSCINLIS